MIAALIQVLFCSHLRRVGVVGTSISCIALIIFLYPYFLIGNRREIVIVLLVLLSVTLVLSRKNVKPAFFIAFLGLVLLAFGLQRSLMGKSVSDMDEIILYRNLFGEFIFPHYPLIYYLENGLSDGFLFGSGYFKLPAYILPNFGLFEKAQTFAVIFSTEYSGRMMGFGFTPVAEGYLNFGIFSICIVPAFVALAMKSLLKFRLFFPFGFLVMTGFALDINRGEFVTLTLQWLIFCICISFFWKIITFSDGSKLR